VWSKKGKKKKASLTSKWRGQEEEKKGPQREEVDRKTLGKKKRGEGPVRALRKKEQKGSGK